MEWRLYSKKLDNLWEENTTFMKTPNAGLQMNQRATTSILD